MGMGKNSAGGGVSLTTGFEHVETLSFRRFLLWLEQLGSVLCELCLKRM
jgi:hypothetical protein